MKSAKQLRLASSLLPLLGILLSPAFVLAQDTVTECHLMMDTAATPHCHDFVHTNGISFGEGYSNSPGTPDWCTSCQSTNLD